MFFFENLQCGGGGPVAGAGLLDGGARGHFLRLNPALGNAPGRWFDPGDLDRVRVFPRGGVLPPVFEAEGIFK